MLASWILAWTLNSGAISASSEVQSMRPQPETRKPLTLHEVVMGVLLETPSFSTPNYNLNTHRVALALKAVNHHEPRCLL